MLRFSYRRPKADAALRTNRPRGAAHHGGKTAPGQFRRTATALSNAIALQALNERDRWFLWVAPLFASGIAAYFALKHEPGTIQTLALVAAALALRILMSANDLLRLITTMVLICATGFGAAKLRTEWVRAPILSETLRSADVSGYLTRIEHRADGRLRLTLSAVAISGLRPENTPRKVRLITPAPPVGGRAEPTMPRLGSRVRLQARLLPPPGPVFPGAYDFAKAGYYRGLGAIGFARSLPQQVDPAGPPPPLIALTTRLQTFRRAIGNRVEAALPGEIGVLANALMTGERSGISKETNEAYRDAGIFHILSISGLHMAIMGGSVFFALRFLLAAVPPLALRYPIKKWAAAVAALATLGYLLISGAAHPTVRSFIMILIMFLAIILDRPALALRNVAIAALVILTFLPESLFEAGFQLSFAAVVALVSAYESYNSYKLRRRRLGLAAQPPTGIYAALHSVWLFFLATIATTLIAGTATAPLSAYHFNAVQQYSVLTNLIAVPVSNLLVMPAALAAFVVMPIGLEGWPLQIMGAGIAMMNWSARLVAALPGAVAAVPSFSPLAIQLIVLGALWFFLWRKKWRLVGLVMIAGGVTLATQPDRPIAIFGNNGRQVAVRGENGEITLLRSRRGSYMLTRWLEADGDRRPPQQAMHPPIRNSKPATTRSTPRKTARSPIRCDLYGCVARVAGYVIAMPKSPMALSDDCKLADIVVLTFPRPRGCRTKAKVFDYPRLLRDGTHAVYLDKTGSLRIVSVREKRGDRPWSRKNYQYAKLRTRSARQRSTTPDLAPVKQTRAAPPARVPPSQYDGRPTYWRD